MLKFSRFNTIGNRVRGYVARTATTGIANGNAMGVFVLQDDCIESVRRDYFSLSQGRLSSNGNRSCDHTSVDGEVINLLSSNVTTYQKTVSGGLSPDYKIERIVLKNYSNGSSIEQCRIANAYRWSHDEIVGTPTQRFRNAQLEIYTVKNISNGVDLTVMKSSYERSYANGPFVRRDSSLWYYARWHNFTVLQSSIELDPENLPSSGWGSMATYRIMPSAYPTMPGSLELLRRASIRTHCSDSPYVFSDLTRRAGEDARFTSVNVLEFLKELPEIGGEIRAFSQAVKGLKKGLRNPREIAKLYLSIKYGTRLTAADIARISNDVRYVNGKVRGTCRASESDQTTTQEGTLVDRGWWVKMYYLHPSTYDLFNTLNLYGLAPTPVAVWELLPYSFAIDWFLDISERLKMYDSRILFVSQPVVETVATSKYVETGPPGEVFPRFWEHCAGEITLRSYNRDVERGLSYPPLYFDVSPKKFNNFVELTALLLAGQRNR